MWEFTAGDEEDEIPKIEKFFKENLQETVWEFTAGDEEDEIHKIEKFFKENSFL